MEGLSLGLFHPRLVSTSMDVILGKSKIKHKQF